MTVKERFSSRGKLWVDTPGSKIVKDLIKRILGVSQKLLKDVFKPRDKIRNPRVGFIHDFFDDLAKASEMKNVKYLLEPMRDFLTLLCDDDRAYFYVMVYALTKLYLKLPDWNVTEEDWYLSADDRRKFNAVRENVARILPASVSRGEPGRG